MPTGSDLHLTDPQLTFRASHTRVLGGPPRRKLYCCSVVQASTREKWVVTVTRTSVRSSCSRKWGNTWEEGECGEAMVATFASLEVEPPGRALPEVNGTGQTRPRLPWSLERAGVACESSRVGWSFSVPGFAPRRSQILDASHLVGT